MDKFYEETRNDINVSLHPTQINNKNENNYKLIIRNEKLGRNNNTYNSMKNKDESKTIKNTKEKKIHYKGTMNNTRGIPPIPNWSNRFSSLILEKNLLYLSNNYIVNIDLHTKEFIQLIHSSLNIYFENKYSVICRIKDLSAKNNIIEESYMFISVDSNGNICFFKKMKEINQNFELSKNTDIAKASYESVYFREERYISKIGRSLVIKTILNINLVNYFDNVSFFDKENEERDLNLILFGDNNGFLHILKYFYIEKEREMQTDKNAFNSIKLAKGICTDIHFITEKNIILISTSSGVVEFYSIMKLSTINERKNTQNSRYNNGDNLIILTHIYDSNLTFIFSTDYFLSLYLDQINLSIIDKNGTFVLQSLHFKDILFNRDEYKNIESQFLINQKSNAQNELDQQLLGYNFSFKIFDKNRFNNKSIKDEYLFFAHKIVFKDKNEKNFVIFFTSNRGKVYYTNIILDDFNDDRNDITDFKLKYFEIPENPHTKNIFSINKFGNNKLLFIGADGVISLFEHFSKFFEMDVKTIKFRPSVFVQNHHKNINLFFYDEGNNLFKYNHNKVNNGLQSIVRKPLKIKNSDEKTFPFLKKNEYSCNKEIKDCIKIKTCIQAKFNENIFALLEFNYIFKSYSISVFDFGSDTRIYRRDLLFKVKSMQFASKRKFESLQELFENRDDLNKSQIKQISKIDDFFNNFDLREESESIADDLNMDGAIDINIDKDSEFNDQENEDENLEIKELIKFEEKQVYEGNNKFLKENDFNLELNENGCNEDYNQVHFEKDLQEKENKRNKTNRSKRDFNKRNKILFDNFDEKKFLYGEKFRQIIQQIFNENNIYELLHVIDEDNNYTVIDFLKNKYNSRKLINFDFNKNKSKNSVDLDQRNENINLINLNERQTNPKQKEKSSKSHQFKFKTSLMIPLIDLNREFNRENSEDILLVKLEGNSIKIGIINQIQDVYIANINLIDNAITYNVSLFTEQFSLLQDKTDMRSVSNSFSEFNHGNDMENFSMELVNLFNSNKQVIRVTENDNVFLITLEKEKNIRIFRIGNSIIALLKKYNIYDNFYKYNQRNREIANLIKESSTSQVNTKINENKNNLLSQIFYRNFTNVSAIDLKAHYIPNIKARMNIIASLIDNSIKFFELTFINDDLTDINNTNLTLKYSINAHLARIQDIVLISETSIASLSYDQSLKIWDVKKCKLIDLPIRNLEYSDINLTKSYDKKESQKVKFDTSNDLLIEKKNSNKVFPIFTKIVNDAIYSQSYAACKEFMNNYSNFFEKLKHMKNKKESHKITMFDINETVEQSYIEFLPLFKESKENIIDKKFLDYLIFTFSEINWINKQTTLYMIKYELSKNNYLNAKINTKNMQTLFCLVFYLFIFNFNNDKNLEEINQIFLKIKLKIQEAHSEHEIEQKQSGENNITAINENNSKFYSNLLSKIEAIMKFIDHELKNLQENNLYNYGESRVKNLVELNQILFYDLPLRENLFFLLINQKYDDVENILYENELYFENLMITKQIFFEESNISFEFNKSLLKFKENLNKFRTFIYPKQIYQAQKCQCVLNVLNEFYN